MKKWCYILSQGAWGSSYPIGIFLKKKDAFVSAREDGLYTYNKKDDLFDHRDNDNDNDYRTVEKLPLLSEIVFGSDLY